MSAGRAARVADPETPPEVARFEAQKLAFAPLVFQACRVARDVGLVGQLFRAGAAGVSAEEAAAACGISLYAAEVLLEGCLAAGLAASRELRFVITKTGLHWEKDPLTRVNADFCHRVCYRGAFHLGEALREGLPAGLRELGDFPTIYEGLSRLEPETRAAWLAFDHYYSDGVFEACLPEVLRGPVRHLVDVGGNTGKFARLVVGRAPETRVTLVDLPGQIELARAELADVLEPSRGEGASPGGGAKRIELVAADMRDARAELPAGADVYWMSQFLDCFGPDEIVAILERARRAMTPASRLYILETFWNEQRFDAARFCVIATTLYFACMANGNSRMYHSADMRRLVARAGLVIEEERHHIGVAHSLLRCRRA